MATLALELVTEMLLLSCGTYLTNRGVFVTRRGTFMLVCTLWRDLVVKCGAFWSAYTIRPLKLRASFDLWTSRFGGHRLDIVVQLDRFIVCSAARPGQLSTTEVLGRLVHFLPACRSLTVEAPDLRTLALLTRVMDDVVMPDLRYLALLSSPLNSAATLSYHSVPPISTAVYPSSFTSGLRGLTFIRLSGLVLTWTHYTCYSTVTTLILQYISATVAPTGNQLHALLICARLVRRLSINGVCCVDSGGDFAPVELLHLESLHIRLASNCPVARILAVIRAPRLTSFHVYIDNRCDLKAIVACRSLLADVTHLVVDGDVGRDPLVSTLFSLMPLVTYCDMAMASDFFAALTRFGPKLFPALTVLVASELRFGDLKLFFNRRGPSGNTLDDLRLRYLHGCCMDASQQTWVRGRVRSLDLDPLWDDLWYHC
ncbi:hypothetical protein DFH06DRAFT_1343346 [Mycena polygramma]|nr:hypothetical protein DFH06DRAFT_1343346 [Mycena polygramma]